MRTALKKIVLPHVYFIFTRMKFIRFIPFTCENILPTPRRPTVTPPSGIWAYASKDARILAQGSAVGANVAAYVLEVFKRKMSPKRATAKVQKKGLGSIPTQRLGESKQTQDLKPVVAGNVLKLSKSHCSQNQKVLSSDQLWGCSRRLQRFFKSGNRLSHTYSYL